MADQDGQGTEEGEKGRKTKKPPRERDRLSCLYYKLSNMCIYILQERSANGKCFPVQCRDNVKLSGIMWDYLGVLWDKIKNVKVL